MSESQGRYPVGLHDWAGHRVGGVRRLFHEESGRPAKIVIRTSLLDRLDSWAAQVANSDSSAPRIVLLVGGPGNGKTEAVEYAIRALDQSIGANGELAAEFHQIFNGDGVLAAPRVARLNARLLGHRQTPLQLAIVQDASAADANQPGRSPASLLVDELEQVVAETSQTVYLACVNRGVLDDALTVAVDENQIVARETLTQIGRSIGGGPASASCWPLEGNRAVAVWPMDIETLIGSHDDACPAGQLLALAIAEGSWPKRGSCAAGEECPFCYSRERLARPSTRASLLKILRWYELSSGKRWSFRDLSSLISFFLAGTGAYGANEGSKGPCDWAADLISGNTTARQRFVAPFLLVSAQYQHALFGSWRRLSARQLRRDLRELGLQQDPVLLGLCQFIGGAGPQSMPPTMLAQLEGLSNALDPALADPDTQVPISDATTVILRDLDVRYSQSVREGNGYILKGARRNWFFPPECSLLEQLAEADERLMTAEIRRRRPAVAFRVQRVLRNFACSLVRRTLGVRSAAVKEGAVLSDFERVVAGDVLLLSNAVRQVQALLNERDKFRVALNTTFGEPMPPQERQAVLVTSSQRVKPLAEIRGGRPAADYRFVSLGSGPISQAIPLTYELFKAAFEMRDGMLPASLPRPVVALLDASRSRLAGQIVRNRDLLEDAQIRIGLLADAILLEQGQFVVREELM